MESISIYVIYIYLGNLYLSIECICIFGIYIAPLQGNYSEALPTKARPERKVLISLWKDLDSSCGRERRSDGKQSPNRETQNRERHWLECQWRDCWTKVKFVLMS